MIDRPKPIDVTLLSEDRACRSRQSCSVIIFLPSSRLCMRLLIA